MRIKLLAVLTVIAALALPLSVAYAQEAQPGDSCAGSTAGDYLRSGGPEVAGGGHFLVCDGSNWVSFLDYEDSGQVLFQVDNDTGSCTAAKDGRVRYNSAASPPWNYCDGGSTTWLPFEGPQCQDDDTGECFLEATRSNDDPDLNAANIANGVNILGITGTSSGGAGIGLWTEEAILTAGDGSFGDDVSIDGDIAVIGSRLLGLDGAAYIFERGSDGSWTQVQEIIGAASNTTFGHSVDVSGDTIVITDAFQGSGGTFQRGDAYIYYRTGGSSWTEVQRLIASDGDTTDLFGNDTSLDGDTLVVGAYSENGAGIARGAAYIFERASNGTWSEIQKITASDTADNDDFGLGVAIDGDTIVVAAPSEAGAGSNRGAAYIFERASDGTWSEIQKITASDSLNSDFFSGNFGSGSVAISGGIIVVGAPMKQNPLSGAAYVFERASNGTWTETQKLASSDPIDYGRFGYSVGIDGDTLVVGAHYENTQRGAAYVFERASNGTWQEIKKIIASDAADSDRFGVSVTVGGNSIIVGPQNTAAAYIFYEN